jgi:glycosyltransferase involved in cell wall biosynthesis
MNSEINEKPLVSVIIPVYNTEKYLAEAIESVLAQTYQPIELIVVDDGSTDGSAAVARRYLPRLTYFYQANAGTSAARNKGLQAAHGEFYAFLDADDTWLENKLAVQHAAFQADPLLDIAFGHVEQFYSPELGEDFRRRVYCPQDWKPGYMSTAMLVKREAFWKVGLFDPRVLIGEEMDWYLRAQEVGLRMVMLPDLVYRRRLHENNKGLRMKNLQSQRARVMKAALDRRRKAAGGREEAPGSD